MKATNVGKMYLRNYILTRDFLSSRKDNPKDYNFIAPYVIIRVLSLKSTHFENAFACALEILLNTDIGNRLKDTRGRGREGEGEMYERVTWKLTLPL